jgi:hypothetical protein
MIWVLVALYFLPSIVAGLRGHHNALSIFILNLFLGWTFFGWIIALAMAHSQVRSTETIVQPVIIERTHPAPESVLDSTHARFCPSCGASRRRADALFCSQCGSRFASKTY